MALQTQVAEKFAQCKHQQRSFLFSSIFKCFFKSIFKRIPMKQNHEQLYKDYLKETVEKNKMKR